MSHIDICEGVKTLLTAEGYTSIKLAREYEPTEGITVRHVPSAITQRYYDEGKTISYIYQVIVTRRSEEDAMDDAADIAALLDGATIDSTNGSYGFTGQELYTPPQELALTVGGLYEYELRISALLEIGGVES